MTYVRHTYDVRTNSVRMPNPKLSMALRKQATKKDATKGGGSAAPKARVVHIAYRSPITNAEKEVKFRIKQESKLVFCSAIADAIC